MMSEKLCELASSGPEVGETMANENGGSGAGQKEACGVQRVACQGYKNGAGAAVAERLQGWEAVLFIRGWHCAGKEQRLAKAAKRVLGWSLEIVCGASVVVMLLYMSIILLQGTMQRRTSVLGDKFRICIMYR